MKIPMIESRASNIPMTKTITYVVITVRPIKIFVEYVGANMGIQVPLLVIDQRGVSVEDITVGVTRPGGAGLPVMVTTRSPVPKMKTADQ